MMILFAQAIFIYYFAKIAKTQIFDCIFIKNFRTSQKTFPFGFFAHSLEISAQLFKSFEKYAKLIHFSIFLRIFLLQNFENFRGLNPGGGAVIYLYLQKNFENRNSIIQIKCYQKRGPMEAWNVDGRWYWKQNIITAKNGRRHGWAK